jgi:NDP-sugar pyrophosphorylase family protein
VSAPHVPERVSAPLELARVPVAILAGGLGTRLRPALGDQPKVLAEIDGRPFVAYLLDQLAAAGFRDAVLCVGWHAEQVERALGSAHGPLRLHYSRELSPLGTAGALRLALPALAGEQVLVMNGDSYCGADLAAAWRWHRERASEATLLLVEVEDTARYGRVELLEDGTICRFVEKQNAAGTGWINAGIYFLAHSRIESIARGTPLSLERDVFPAWVGHGLWGLRSRARFLDIGTPRSYAGASAFFQAEGSASRR